MEPQVIKTEDEYRICLEEVERLAANDPPPDSPDGGRLVLLAKLLEEYEFAKVL